MNQLDHGLPLPKPIDYANVLEVELAVNYLKSEYGGNWVGTRSLGAGVVLHHGDIPQETREVVEDLLRRGRVRLAVCTNTLAEGVNLPIRTLVLYSVRRNKADGRAVDLLTRDIKNLVGRAGRPGATMRGLVFSANPDQWPLVERVAKQSAGEPVRGALRRLMVLLRQALSIHGAVLTNDILEETSMLQPLVDGVDSTIFDLAAEEIGEEELSRIAMTVAHETFAFEHLDADTRILLEEVFRLRAQRVSNVYSSGRFAWIRETGAKMRLVDTVEAELLPKLEDWSELTDPLEPRLVAALLQWAWGQVDVQAAVRKAYELDDGIATATVQKSFNAMVDAWLSGARWVEIATRSDRTVDEALNIYAQVLAYVIQSNIDQGVALLDRVLQSKDLQLADSVKSFPNHLRFGVPNAGARALAEAGVRHRHACVEVGRIPAVAAAAESQTDVVGTARSTLESRREEFQTILGLLVYKRTLRDLTQRRGR